MVVTVYELCSQEKKLKTSKFIEKHGMASITRLWTKYVFTYSSLCFGFMLFSFPFLFFSLLNSPLLMLFHFLGSQEIPLICRTKS